MTGGDFWGGEGNFWGLVAIVAAAGVTGLVVLANKWREKLVAPSPRPQEPTDPVPPALPDERS